MRAVVFDLGDTLVEYEGMPLSWEAHYPRALSELTRALGTSLSAEAMVTACGVLRTFNTRVNPRVDGVSFQTILGRLAEFVGVQPALTEVEAARFFFDVFRRRLRCFPDARPALNELRARGVQIGIFTDVPYGMPTELVLEDLVETGLRSSFDVFLTSRDVGVRKPAPETLRRMAARLNCSAAEMAHVGNERKDIDVANAFGCVSILIDRNAMKPEWGQTRTLNSLSELIGATGV